jgi:hypothetical protein
VLFTPDILGTNLSQLVNLCLLLGSDLEFFTLHSRNFLQRRVSFLLELFLSQPYLELVSSTVHQQLDSFEIFILPEVDVLDAIRKRIEELREFYDRILGSQQLDLDKMWDGGQAVPFPKSYVKLGKEPESPFVSQYLQHCFG